MTKVPERAELIERLKEACVGHPHAKIPWPHRLLHDAIDALSASGAKITVLEAQISELQSQIISMEATSTGSVGDEYDAPLYE